MQTLFSDHLLFSLRPHISRSFGNLTKSTCDKGHTREGVSVLHYGGPGTAHFLLCSSEGRFGLFGRLKPLVHLFNFPVDHGVARNDFIGQHDLSVEGGHFGCCSGCKLV